LRVGELLGLKWMDVDFEKLEINVTRSVVKQRIGPCKTEASQKPIPLHAELGEQVWNWRLKTPYNRPEDWVFASPHKHGTQPYWPGSLFRAHLQPALREAEISGKVGWQCAGINRHAAENARVLQERSSEPPGLESCGGSREAAVEA
jgi:integrase